MAEHVGHTEHGCGQQSS